MSWSVCLPCPSCKAPLKVKKPSLIGKQVPCPSCRTPFLIRIAAERREPLPESEATGIVKRPARHDEDRLPLLQGDARRKIALLTVPDESSAARPILFQDGPLPVLEDRPRVNNMPLSAAFDPTPVYGSAVRPSSSVVPKIPRPRMPAGKKSSDRKPTAAPIGSANIVSNVDRTPEGRSGSNSSIASAQSAAFEAMLADIESKDDA